MHSKGRTITLSGFLTATTSFSDSCCPYVLFVCFVFFIITVKKNLMELLSFLQGWKDLFSWIIPAFSKSSVHGQLALCTCWSLKVAKVCARGFFFHILANRNLRGWGTKGRVWIRCSPMYVLPRPCFLQLCLSIFLSSFLNNQ